MCIFFIKHRYHAHTHARTHTHSTHTHTRPLRSLDFGTRLSVVVLLTWREEIKQRLAVSVAPISPSQISPGQRSLAFPRELGIVLSSSQVSLCDITPVSRYPGRLACGFSSSSVSLCDITPVSRYPGRLGMWLLFLLLRGPL